MEAAGQARRTGRVNIKAMLLQSRPMLRLVRFLLPRAMTRSRLAKRLAHTLGWYLVWLIIGLALGLASVAWDWAKHAAAVYDGLTPAFMPIPAMVFAFAYAQHRDLVRRIGEWSSSVEAVMRLLHAYGDDVSNLRQPLSTLRDLVARGKVLAVDPLKLQPLTDLLHHLRLYMEAYDPTFPEHTRQAIKNDERVARRSSYVELRNQIACGV